MMLRQLQHFQTVIQENSFTEAAELCHISQSGISRSIQSLEDEIGAKLIIRKNRSFELTEAGEHFYKKSLIITADLEQLCHETVRIARKDAAELRLGGLSTYSGDQFNRAVAAFSEKYPTVDIFGEGMKDYWKSGPEESRHINYWLADNCFRDYYTRTGLDYIQNGCVGAKFLPDMKIQFDSQGGSDMLTSQADISAWIERVTKAI